MNIKKILPIVLSISCMFNSFLSVQISAEEHCAAKNSKGGYIHYDCANPELAKVWKNQLDYATVKNLGSTGDDEYYCFNFRALNDVFEKKKLKSTDTLNKECELLSKMNYPNFLNLKTFLIIGFTSLIGGICGYFPRKILNYGDVKNLKMKSSISPSSQESSSTSSQTSRALSPCEFIQPKKAKLSVLSSCIVSLITGLITTICLYIAYDINKSNFYIEKNNKLEELNNKIFNIDKENERNANMLNLLLYSLENPEIMSYADMFCFYDTFNSSGTPFDWDAKNVGINYTKEEVAVFPKKFKEICTKIRNNLAENGYLDPDNACDNVKKYNQLPMN